jgi:hypothetical protein
MDAFKRWATPIVLVLAWLLTAGYTLASLSQASAAWRARTAPVPVEAKRTRMTVFDGNRPLFGER